MNKNLSPHELGKIINGNDTEKVDTLRTSEKLNILFTIIGNYAYKDSNIFEYILKKGIDLSYQDKNTITRSLLAYATSANKIKFCEMLLNYGASIYEDNSKPIHEALVIGNIEILKLFEKNGLFFSEIYEVIIKNGHVDLLKYLIEEKGISTHIDGREILLAATYGHLEIVKYLISKGSNPMSKNNLEEDSLVCAVKRGHLNVVEYLIQEGYENTSLAFESEQYPEIQEWLEKYKRSKDLNEKLEIHLEKENNSALNGIKKLKI